MPELPEAEANRRRIERHCLNRTIEAVDLGNDVEYVELPSAEDRARLVGRQFSEARRHGKYIFAGSQSGPWIAVHLGMSGLLRPYAADDPQPDYARITLRFEGDTRLAFRCPRKFGWVRVIDDPDQLITEKGLGPDAMSVSADAFARIVGGADGMLKPALLKQEKIAGIGNLWSDELLFQTGHHPEAKGSGLSERALTDMHGTMRDILKAVSDTEIDYSRLPDDWLISHRDKGAECRRCGGEIVKKTVGGRSAFYCTGHQG